MLATVSVDRTIKILKRVDKQWIEIQEINYNESSHGHRDRPQTAIIDICWAHPSFGSIFATLSVDKTIQIFELRLTDHTDGAQSFEFVPTAHFTESVDIASCQFAPHHLGLKLAIVCKNGIVKIREARNISNLSQWMLSERIMMHQNHMKPFDTLPFNPHSICNPNAHSMRMHSDNTHHTKDTKLFCISWNHSKFEFPSFCVGGSNNALYIFGYTAMPPHHHANSKLNKTWNCIQKLMIPASNQHTFDIHAVCWSPAIGRKYHLIAIGGSDGFVRVIKISKYSEKNTNGPFKWNLIYKSQIHNTSVCKVTWNVRGTCLLSVDRHRNVSLLRKDRRQNTYVVSDLTTSDSVREEHKQEESPVKNENDNHHNNNKNNPFGGFGSNDSHNSASDAPNPFSGGFGGFGNVNNNGSGSGFSFGGHAPAAAPAPWSWGGDDNK